MMEDEETTYDTLEGMDFPNERCELDFAGDVTVEGEEGNGNKSAARKNVMRRGGNDENEVSGLPRKLTMIGNRLVRPLPPPSGKVDDEIWSGKGGAGSQNNGFPTFSPHDQDDQMQHAPLQQFAFSPFRPLAQPRTPMKAVPWVASESKDYEMNRGEEEVPGTVKKRTNTLGLKAKDSVIRMNDAAG